MSKYDVDKGYGFFRYFKTPVSRFILPFSNIFLTLLPKKNKSDSQTEVKKIKIDKRTKALLYSPKGVQGELPCLIYLHGGGFVMQSAPHHYALAREYAIRLNCRVLLVNYPLAPKHPFPQPFDGCVNSLKYILDNCKQLNIDCSSIAVGGDSAGGCLSASLAIWARDNGINLRCQMLAYPTTDRRMLTDSVKKYKDTPMWGSSMTPKIWKMYDKGLHGLPPEYISPMEAENLEGVCAAYIETAEFDSLHDEAILYGEKLESFGVTVAYNNTCHTMHGFDIKQKHPITRHAVEKRIDFLNTYLKK